MVISKILKMYLRDTNQFHAMLYLDYRQHLLDKNTVNMFGQEWWTIIFVFLNHFTERIKRLVDSVDQCKYFYDLIKLNNLLARI